MNVVVVVVVVVYLSWFCCLGSEVAFEAQDPSSVDGLLKGMRTLFKLRASPWDQSVHVTVCRCNSAVSCLCCRACSLGALA
jgi:hypothetical protein